MKKLTGCLVILLASVLAGFLLITAVYALPVPPMRAHALRSAEIFAAEGNYPKLIQRHFYTTLDNWTDATILAEAAYDGEMDLLRRAMLNPHLEAEGENRAESYVKLFAGDEQAAVITEEYGRYWHGYLLFIKPLLLLTDYGGLRDLMGFLQLALFLLAAWLLARRGRPELAAALSLVYAFLGPAVVSMTINYAVIWFLLLGEILFILRHDALFSRRGFWLYHFVTVGCMTAFFDYLTYPLATYGVAMLLLLALYPDRPREDFRQTVETGLGWLFGYAGMWAAKWVLGSLITGSDILRDALDTAAMRSGGDVGEDFSRAGLMFAAIYKNLTANKLVLGLTGAALIAAFLLLTLRRRKPDIARTALICAFMAAPLVWYAGAANHSYIHYFFTYRTLSISVFGAVLLTADFLTLIRKRSN